MESKGASFVRTLLVHQDSRAAPPRAQGAAEGGRADGAAPPGGRRTAARDDPSRDLGAAPVLPGGILRVEGAREAACRRAALARSLAARAARESRRGARDAAPGRSRLVG